MSLEAKIEVLNEKIEILNGLITKVIEGYAPGAAEAKAEPDKKPAKKSAEAKAEKTEPVVGKDSTGSDWTEATLKKALVALVNAHSRAAMEKLLAQFGAAKFSELPTDKYAEVGAAVEAQLKE